MATKSVRVDVRQETNLPESLQAEREIAELYEQYEQQISAYANKRTSSANANDVVAETFLTAWRRREDIPAEPQTLPWLYGVSRRVLANRRRSDDRYQRLRDRITREPESERTPITLIESKDAFSEVSAAIKALDDNDAEILRLTAWEGLTPTEIAGALGIEPSAARQRLFRARQRLAEQLERQAAQKERRRIVRAAAAAIIALFVVVTGVFASRLFTEGATLESDLINQVENSNTREVIDPDIVDENARTGVEAEGDFSQLETADVPEAMPFEEVEEPEDVVDQTDTTEPIVEDTAPAEPAPQPEPQPAEPAAGANVVAAASSETSPTEETAVDIDTVPEPAFDVATGPFVQGQDLFIFQLDFAGLDDAHAAVATAEAVSGYGIEPIVVAGTTALASESDTVDYAGVMNATWGNEWFDAQAARSVAIAEIADRWLETLDAGGHVWIAEGGVSDFTADVLREVQIRRPNIDTTSTVHVVHHSSRNVNSTVGADLALIRSETDFIRIEDGNVANGTADLELPADSFEAAALAGEFAQGWAAAFEIMPSPELDFSDTVTTLHLLGVGIDMVATPSDFEEYFLR